ncbi:MAG: hypothetical protein Kow002_07230 [Anaerolineales bacterium]
MDRKTLLLITITLEGGLFLLGLYLFKISSIDLSSQLTLTWRATFLAFFFCLPMLTALYFTMKTDWPPLSRLRGEIEERIRPLFAKSKIIDLLIISIFAGVAEELFFRGWMQTVLADKFGLLLGIALTSLLFGLAHYLSKEYALYAFVTSLYLGVIFHFTGNLYILMAAHAAYDFVALGYFLTKNNQALK